MDIRHRGLDHDRPRYPHLVVRTHFPDKSRFLNEEERKACRIHLESKFPGTNM